MVGQLLQRACQHQVRLNATAVVYDANRGLSPSRSLRSGVVGWIGTLLSLSPFFLSIFYPYLMLTLVLISNSWYQSVRD